MKIPDLKNLNFTLRIGLALIAIITVFIINSCRKDVHRTKQQYAPLLTDHPVNIAMLQRTYNKGINGGKLRINDVSQQAMDKIISSLTVDWTSYSIATYADSTQVIEFSMPDDTSLLTPTKLNINDTVKYNSKTTAVFILRKDTVNMSFFMKTIEDGTSPGYQPSLEKLHYKQVPYTFTGTILYFTFDRQFINGYKWENGAIAKAIELGGTPTTQQIKNSGKLKTDNIIAITSCVTTEYELYAVTIYNGTITHEEYICTFTVQVCNTTYVDGGVSGDTSVGPPNPCTPTQPPVNVASVNGKLHVEYLQPPPTGGSSGGSTPCPTTRVSTSLASIINTVKNACLAALLNKLKDDNTLQTDVTNQLRNTFGVNEQVNVTFIDGDFRNDPNVGTGSAGTDGVSTNNFEIKFNTPIISNSSKEYLMETAIHEIFHAYLYAHPAVKNGLSQHTYMIQNYVNTEVATLRQVFPSLSVHDAQCLVLGGYGDLDPSTFNSACSLYNLTSGDISTTNNKFKTGTAGTKC